MYFTLFLFIRSRWHLTLLLGWILYGSMSAAIASTPLFPSTSSLSMLSALPAEHPVQSVDMALFTDLYQGGYVFYIRHGITNSSIPDQVPVLLHDCATQRPLNAIGREQMRQLGLALQQVNWPLGEVYVSPFCRTQDSADLTFGVGQWQLEPLLMYTAAMSRAEKDPVVRRTRELVSLPVESGTNRALLAHGPNLAEIMGYFPPEGTLVILQPDATGFAYRASILPDQWPAIFALWRTYTEAATLAEEDGQP